jgi:hypothetical protein
LLTGKPDPAKDRDLLLENPKNVPTLATQRDSSGIVSRRGVQLQEQLVDGIVHFPMLCKNYKIL